MAAARILRSEFLVMATAAARAARRTETLRLVTPNLSERRIEEEWLTAAEVLRPKVLERLSLEVVFTDGRSERLAAARTGRHSARWSSKAEFTESTASRAATWPSPSRGSSRGPG